MFSLTKNFQFGTKISIRYKNVRFDAKKIRCLPILFVAESTVVAVRELLHFELNKKFEQFYLFLIELQGFIAVFWAHIF